MRVWIIRTIGKYWSGIVKRWPPADITQEMQRNEIALGHAIRALRRCHLPAAEINALLEKIGKETR